MNLIVFDHLHKPDGWLELHIDTLFLLPPHTHTLRLCSQQLFSLLHLSSSFFLSFSTSFTYVSFYLLFLFIFFSLPTPVFHFLLPFLIHYSLLSTSSHSSTSISSFATIFFSYLPPPRSSPPSSLYPAPLPPIRSHPFFVIQKERLDLGS